MEMEDSSVVKVVLQPTWWRLARRRTGRWGGRTSPRCPCWISKVFPACHCHRTSNVLSAMIIITIRRGMGTAPSSLTGMEPQMQLHSHWCVPFFSPSDDRTLIQSVDQNKNVNTQVPPLPAYIAYTSFVLFRFHLFSFYWCFTVANEVCGNCLMKGWSDV